MVPTCDAGGSSILAPVALPFAGDPKAAQTLKAKRLSLAAPIPTSPLSAGGEGGSKIENRKSVASPLSHSGSIKSDHRKSMTGPLSASGSAITREGTQKAPPLSGVKLVRRGRTEALT
jgi:hypothetical protein